MGHPVERSLIVERLEAVVVGVRIPHSLVRVAAGLKAEHYLLGAEAAGLDMAYAEIHVRQHRDFAGPEIHLADSAQALAHLLGLVVAGNEGLGLHGGPFLRGAFAGHGDVGESVIAVDAPSSGTSHLGRLGEGSYIFEVAVEIAGIAFLGISEVFGEVHHIHLPFAVLHSVQEHSVGLVGEEHRANLAVGRLDDLSACDFDEIILGRLVFDLPSVRSGAGHGLAVTSVGRTEQQILSVGRPHGVGLIDELVVFVRVRENLELDSSHGILDGLGL